MSEEQFPASAVIEGDADFLAAMEGKEKPMVLYDKDGVEQIPITVDKNGDIVGDLTNVPQHVIDQLSTSEAKARINALWKESKYGKKEPPRPVKYITETIVDPIRHGLGDPKAAVFQRRDFTALRMADPRTAGMDARTFRRLKKKAFHKMSKAVLRNQRSQTNEANYANAGSDDQLLASVS